MSGFIKNLRIKHKLLAILSLVVVITFLLSMIAVQISFNMYDNFIYDISADMLKQSFQSVESKLKDINKLSLNILSDSSIQEYLKDIKDNDLSYTGYKSKQLLTRKLEYYSLNEKYVKYISIIDTRGNEYTKGFDDTVLSRERIAEITQRAVAKKR